jgi:predicted PhzF superfamily epimerase YddE/YHI9
MVLCGHATLAAAHVLFAIEKYNKSEIKFQTKSGLLTVTKNGNQYEMNFPVDEPKQITLTPEINSVLDNKVVEAYHGRNVLFVVLNSE